MREMASVPVTSPDQNASTSPSGVTTPAATMATGSVRRRTTPDVEDDAEDAGANDRRRRHQRSRE